MLMYINLPANTEEVTIQEFTNAKVIKSGNEGLRQNSLN
jgi:hypothetical protein